MLSEYKGASNSAELFPYLVGEKITGCFSTGEHKILILESGAGLVFTGAYWKEPKDKIDRRVKARKEDIERMLKELRDITVLG